MSKLYRSILVMLTLIMLCTLFFVLNKDVSLYDKRKITITFVSSDNNATIVGKTTQTIYKNEYSSAVTAVANYGYKFVKWSNDDINNTISVKSDVDLTITCYVEKTQEIYPLLTINTQDSKAIESKEEWIACSISTTSNDEQYVINNEQAKIKGRGNSTWSMPKKPYKFKFNSKTNLFGMGKAKNWVLLANYCDPSALRNGVAYSIGKNIEEIKNDTIDFVFVEVVLNGEYQGVYQLCEQIEIQSKRVDIDDDVTKVDTGYILEIDFRAPDEGVENNDYFTINESCYAVKEPDPDDDLTTDQMNFIKNYVNESVTALYSNNYDEVIKYIDVDTFAATYIVEELFNNVDVGGTSFYMYKDSGKKLSCGPLWDFDISSGNCDYVDVSLNTNYIYAGSVNEWYRCLLKYDEFKTLVGRLLEEYKDDIKLTIENVTNDALNNKNAYYRNNVKWKTIGVYVWPNSQEIVDIKTWEGNVEYLKNWLLNSLDYLVDYYKVEN